MSGGPTGLSAETSMKLLTLEGSSQTARIEVFPVLVDAVVKCGQRLELARNARRETRSWELR
jgi:hypothetical protein